MLALSMRRLFVNGDLYEMLTDGSANEFRDWLAGTEYMEFTLVEGAETYSPCNTASPLNFYLNQSK